MRVLPAFPQSRHMSFIHILLIEEIDLQLRHSPFIGVFSSTVGLVVRVAELLLCLGDLLGNVLGAGVESPPAAGVEG